jgi:hypothetical protein
MVKWKNASMVEATVAVLMQWLAVRKYGVPGLSELLSRPPEHMQSRRLSTNCMWAMAVLAAAMLKTP